jgi:type IX secretion system PorP/SprF family membrane protein
MKIYSFLFVQLLFTSLCFSQQLPVLDQNLINRFSIQPGYTGENRGLHMWDGFRNNLVGLSQNPTTLAFNLSYRDTEKHGFGANFMSDKTGLFSNTFFQLSYAYRVKLANNAALSFGFSGGIAQNRFDFNSVIVADKSDIGTVSNMGKTMFQAGFGTSYSTERFTVGVGFPSLYNTKVLYDIRATQYTYQLDPLFVFNSSYVFDVKQCNDLEIIPTVIVRAQRSLPTLADIVVAARYKKMYSLTAGYRTNGSFPVVAMANVYKNWKVYAGYDANIGNLAFASKGGFEAGIGYKFALLSGSEHKLEDLRMKNHSDSLTKVVTVLKDKISENEKKIAEIKDLSQEVSVLKKENEELRTENDTLSQQLRRIISTGVIPKNNGTTRIDENDVEINIQNGYFVVVESSKNRVELEKDLMEWRRKEGSTFILRGDHGNWYYIAIEHHTTKRKAIRRMEEIRKKYPNAWVRIQKNKG